MTEDELKKADELHMEGKAIIGLVAFLLLIIGIAWLSYETGAMDTDYRQLKYFDGPINTEVEHIA